MAEYNPSKIIKDGNTYNFRDTTKIPLAGSNQISGSLIPSTDGTVNLGGSSYQWNNAYIKSLTINGVACGDILTHNASEFVDVSSNQTIGGIKTFSGSFSVNKPSPRLQTKSTAYSSETSSAMTITDIAFLNNSGGFSAWIVHQLRDDLTKRLCFRVYPHTTGTPYRGFVFDDNCNLYPENSSSALGTSANKWKSINGINPGALSLPGTFVNIDTTNWVLDGSNVNIFTPASDGWLGIQATDTVYDQMHYVFVGRNDSASYHSQNILSPINGLWLGSYHGCVFIPVVKNVRYDIRCICSRIIATFYPCQGNV